MSNHLTSITALSISDIEKLAFLPTWFTQDLMGLEKLDISNCQELITLWRNKVRIQVCLPSLCHLKISYCPKVVCLFEEEQEKGGEGWKRQQHEGLPCMTRLEYLTIEECGMLKKLPQDLHTYTSLGVLRIHHCASLISFLMKGLPSMLRELRVSNCDALESLPKLMTLNNLQELLVSECASLTYLLSRGGLPSTLKQLGIELCENLESLFVAEGIKIDCPPLETICIEFCGSLKSLPEANNLRNLSELQINYCYNLEPLSLGGHDENNNNMNQLSSLQKLCLYKCRAGMVSYFVKEGSFPTNITSLEIGNLRGDDVGQLPLPLKWGLYKLSSLTTLQLQGRDWPWRDTVSFPEEGMFLPTSLLNLTILHFPNLERLSYEEFRNLTSLQTLEIWGCPRLASFPKEGLPPSLLLLSIYNCPELATFPEQGLPPSLLSLDIGRCNPILKQKCEKGKEYWPIIQYIPNVDLRHTKLNPCDNCLFGKHHRVAFHSSSRRQSELLSRVYSDVCGPIEVESLGGRKYFLTFIDDASRKVWVYVLKTKAEVFQHFQTFHAMVERETGKKLKCLRTDNGGEYTSKEFKAYCATHGIRHEKTVPGTPQHNGVAERMNRTIVEKVRCMLKMAKLPKPFWGEAVLVACYLINRSPSVPLNFQIPDEVWSGREISYSHLRMFGCKAFAHVSKEHRQKLDDKATPCIFIGYGDEEFGYRLWDPKHKKVIRSRDVVFQEGQTFEDFGQPAKPKVDDVSEIIPNPAPSQHATDEEELPQHAVNDVELQDGFLEEEDPEAEGVEQGEPQPPLLETVGPQLRRSTREFKPSTKYPTSEYILLTDEGEPESFQEAQNHKEKSSWQQAMQEEMQSLQKN
ncbi:unnamed protein product [Camellia sinensis]